MKARQKAISAFVFHVVAIVAVCACSCSSPYRSAPEHRPEDGPVATREESLFAPRTGGQGERLVDFETSDVAYLSPDGHTLWSLNAGLQDVFATRRVSAAKLSGFGATGFGIVFCHHTSPRPSDETMLVVMINIEQEFIVGEAKGSFFSPLVEWTTSSALKRGYGQTNELIVRIDPETRLFSLFLNGIKACDFAPSDPKYDLGGGNGYIVVLSQRENFPSAPVHVVFTEHDQ